MGGKPLAPERETARQRTELEQGSNRSIDPVSLSAPSAPRGSAVRTSATIGLHVWQCVLRESWPDGIHRRFLPEKLKTFRRVTVETPRAMLARQVYLGLWFKSNQPNDRRVNISPFAVETFSIGRMCRVRTTVVVVRHLRGWRDRSP